MTVEKDSRRHPSNRGRFEAVPVPTRSDPDAVVPGRFINWRTLDPVRAAALANAVDLTAGIGSVGPVHSEDLSAYILDLARTFEAYLTGEEANDESSPHPFIDGQRPTALPGAQCLLITGPGRICGHRRADPIHKEANVT
jgi:hypothetical protein